MEFVMLDPYIRATLQHDSQVEDICHPIFAFPLYTDLPQLMMLLQHHIAPQNPTCHWSCGTVGQFLHKVQGAGRVWRLQVCHPVLRAWVQPHRAIEADCGVHQLSRPCDYLAFPAVVQWGRD